MSDCVKCTVKPIAIEYMCFGCYAQHNQWLKAPFDSPDEKRYTMSFHNDITDPSIVVHIAGEKAPMDQFYNQLGQLMDKGEKYDAIMAHLESQYDYDFISQGDEYEDGTKQQLIIELFKIAESGLSK